MNRIRAGYCTVPSPFNLAQVSTISLKPEDVDVIVFWTRHARPLFASLGELDRRGYRYYFLYTLMDNPRQIDPKSPPLKAALRTFQELSGRIGASRVIWRYDPIVFSNVTGACFHRETYRRIAEALRGYTFRSVFSRMSPYRKAAGRMRTLQEKGVEIGSVETLPSADLEELLSAMKRSAAENGMELRSCSEKPDLLQHGIQPGKCIDDEYIARTFGLRISPEKDPSQRSHCGCVVSKDIGMYDSCTFGCAYCYANKSFELAGRNRRAHDPDSTSLFRTSTDVPPAP